MSNLERTPALGTYRGAGVAAAVHDVFAGREVWLGESTKVRRLLPNLGRRLVGPWCFVDHYGPDDIATGPGMQVPPHPHMGLQTVSWLLSGEVHHRDSIGSDALIRPGQLGLMTSGHGIAHAEQSPAVPAGAPGLTVGAAPQAAPRAAPRHPAMLHGVQLWVALPEPAREVAPAWAYHADLPRFSDAGTTTTVIMGSLGGATSPGQAYSPIIGADVTLDAGADALLPLEPDFEHAVLVTSGAVEVDGVMLGPGSMLYLGTARRVLRVASTAPARILLLGGEPFAEQIVMWWNFVARSSDEIAAAREQWTDGSRFGTVAGGLAPLAAPPIPPGRLKPGGAVR